MPRNMSFAMTTDQIKDRSKDVTRRFGWWFLKPGDVVNAVEKAMGLKKGEKIVRLCQIKIISTRSELVTDIDRADCIREGFPKFEPIDFVLLLRGAYGEKKLLEPVNRIEFEYLDSPQ